MVRRPRQDAVDCRHPVDGLCFLETRKDAKELVAPETNEKIVRPEIGAEDIGDLAQYPVSFGVATRIVDGLETIHINERHDECLVGTTGSCHLSLELHESDTAAVCAGQVIQTGRVSILGLRHSIPERASAVICPGSAVL